MVYLFCNRQYGHKFMWAAIDYAKKNNMTLCVVFSENPAPTESLFKKLMCRVRWGLRKFIREKKLKLRYGVPVVFADNVNSENFRKRIRAQSHGVIAGFNQIFDKQTIERFETLVNFHPSILPLYRGPAPSCWCLKNGEQATGYTLHDVTERIDEGKIYYQEVVKIEDGDDEASLDQKIAAVACSVFKEYLKYIQYKAAWEQKLVDAYAVYNSHVSYVSFPNK